MTVYHIWRNQNAFKHNNHPLSDEVQLLQKIKWEVRLRVVGKGRFKRTEGNERLCCIWGIDPQILV